MDLLDNDERGRRDRLRRPVDAARFTVGAALLRLVVGADLQIPPSSITVDRTCPICARPHGRPRIVNSDLHVSVAHSAARVAVAVTRSGPVGVDVEQVTAIDVGSLRSYVMAGRESFPITSAGDFFVHWTRKEAVLKATGDGLLIPMSEVVVTAPDEAPRLMHYPGSGALAAQLVDLQPGFGYSGAVAVLGADGVVLEECCGDRLLA